jgi:predicted dehydrogenase
MVRVAVLGLGRVGFSFGKENRVQPASHVACYNALDSVDGIAVVDTDVKKLQPALESISKYNIGYVNLKEMLLEFQPQVVSICTPTNTHHQMVLEVAKHSCVKAIFLEKPIAQSLQEADEMIDACARKHIRLTVNYTRRWDHVYMKWCEHSLDLEISTMIGHHPGPLLRTGTHMLDLFNWVMKDSPISVQAFGMPRENYITNDTNHDYNISGCIDYGDVEAVLVSGESKPYVLFELDLFSDHGRVRLVDNGSRIEVYGKAPSIRYSGLNELHRTSDNFEGSERQNPLLNAVTEVVKGEKQRCTGFDARETLHVALALHYSAMNNNMRVRLEDVSKDYTVRSY